MRSQKHWSPVTVTMVEWTEELYPNVTDVQPLESFEDYQPGGFHPVALGDTFQDGRYVVRHKLGFGGRATVWLVQDTHQKYLLPAPSAPPPRAGPPKCHCFSPTDLE